MKQSVVDLERPTPPEHGEFDLDALEHTRLGLKVVAVGILLVMLTVAGSPELEGVLALARAAGWAVLGLGLALCSPTPNGPLPSVLKRGYVVLCALAALRIVKNLAWPRLGLESNEVVAQVERALVIALVIAWLALPWILWRFCQHRGLTGRALTWLWAAVLLLGLFIAHRMFESRWIVLAYPAVGVLLFVITRQTARDLWLDAINRQTKSLARAAS